MKILVNTATVFKGGSVQVARSFLEEARGLRGYEFHVVVGPSLVPIVESIPFPSNFVFHRIDSRPAEKLLGPILGSSFHRAVEREVRPNAVFTTSGPAYWRPTAPHLVGYNLPHFVYPESPYWSTVPLSARLRWKLKGMAVRHLLKHEGDAFVVQTDDVNQRLRVFLNHDEVYTVSNTCGGHYLRDSPAPNRLPERSGGEFRLLTLSAWYPHKHLNVIPDVIEALPPQVTERIRFVLTLPKADYEREFTSRVRDRIVNVGPVRMEDGPALYRECDALFLPTLLECFSASYVEAMAMNRPILTSDLDFARSICKSAAVYFDPMDPASIANAICSVAESDTLRHDLVRQGEEELAKFDSARTRAEKFIRICEMISGWKTD